MLGWWRRRSQAARVDIYVRASFYLSFATVPLVAAGLTPGLGRGAWLVLPLILAHVALCLLLVRAGLAFHLGRRGYPGRLLAVVVALTVAGVAAGAVLYRDSLATGIVVLLAGSFVAALVTVARAAVTAAAGVAACVIVYLLSSDPAAAFGYAWVLAAVGFAGRTSMWLLGVVWELEQARHVQASLAVAEERLRFARDLHDVAGRSLSVISLKAELAAQLARRGRDSAIDEMLEVRRVAQESMAELRAVVGGYRATDLQAELAGARSLLASAGITGRVIGDGAGLPAAVQATLAWAVREGTTNVLRHSDARTCTVTLRPAAGGVTLVMENDGVSTAGRVPFGGGLTGLAERVATVSGKVTADRPAPDAFRLTVEVPTTSSSPAVPSSSPAASSSSPAVPSSSPAVPSSSPAVPPAAPSAEPLSAPEPAPVEPA